MRDSDEVDLFNYVVILLKWKKLIIVMTLAFAVVAGIIGFILPKTYRATAYVLSSQQNTVSINSQLLNQLGSLVVPEMGMAKSLNDLYAGILVNEIVLDKIIDHFDLLKVYDVAYRQDARRRLCNQVKVQNDRRSGIVSVTVEDRSKNRAADMANKFIEELRAVMKNLAVTEASQRRIFFQEQVKIVKKSLESAEEGMKGFQERSGVIKLEEQAKATIESIAQIRAEIAAREVELKVLKTYATSYNPDLRKLNEEIKGLGEQLALLEGKKGKDSNPVLTSGRVPEANIGYVRKLRELKYYENLYEIVTKQLEMARIDEANDAIAVNVLYKATVPEKKYKPKKSIWVVFGGVSGFLLSIAIVFVMECREGILSDPGNRDLIENLKKYSSFHIRD